MPTSASISYLISHYSIPANKPVKQVNLKYINILALEVASARNRQCASCIGALSFAVAKRRRTAMHEPIDCNSLNN